MTITLEQWAEMTAANSAEMTAPEWAALLPAPALFVVEGVGAGVGEKGPFLRLQLAKVPKPARLSKGMQRLLGQLWGHPRPEWVGRELVLYYDAAVEYGGKRTGGVRIRAVSHIPRNIELPVKLSRHATVPWPVAKVVAFADVVAAAAARAPSSTPVSVVEALLGRLQEGASWEDLVQARASQIDRLATPEGAAKFLTALEKANV